MTHSVAERHSDLLEDEESPRIGYIERFYGQNRRLYRPGKIDEIESLSAKERAHVKQHILFRLEGQAKAKGLKVSVVKVRGREAVRVRDSKGRFAKLA